jgi:two-component system phosphate regulon response regulator OmpR
MHEILKILIVDDDVKLRQLLSKYLLEQSFDVTSACNTSDAERELNQHRFDVMILDMMMPGENGLDFCKRLRSMGNHIPIIMLSAKGDDIDKIIGLEVGMDDYLSKPFNPRELVARIKAILRRPKLAEKIHNAKQSYAVGDFTFNLVQRNLSIDGKQEIQLTSTEYDLLKVLVENANTPLSRDSLMRVLHAKEFNIFDRSIDVLISRLRKIIEKDAKNPEIIKTVWGVGYVLVQSD